MDSMNPFGGGPNLRALLAAMVQQMMSQQNSTGGGPEAGIGPMGPNQTSWPDFDSGAGGSPGAIGMGTQLDTSPSQIGYSNQNMPGQAFRLGQGGGGFQFDPSRPQMQHQQGMQGGGSALGSLGLAARLIAAAMGGGGGGYDQNAGPNSGMLGLGRQMTDIQPRNSAPLMRRPMGQGFQFDPARPAMLGIARDRNVR